MNNYAFYVRSAGGGFRYLCIAFFNRDDEAAALALRLVPHCGGVDVWRDQKRVGLFLAADAA